MGSHVNILDAAHGSLALRETLPKVGGLIPLPLDWPSEQGESGTGGAAVMLLFLPALPGQGARVMLTRRSTKVSSHKGQISMPGGRSIPGETPMVTALRETREEVGIAGASIHVMGGLKPFRALDGSCVVPLVGCAAIQEHALVIDGREVADILLVDWTKLMRSQSQSFSFNLFGLHRSSYLFQLDAGRVWGLTAAVIYEADLESG